VADPAVVNASPFIHLARIGRLALLRAAGDPVWMPDVVEREIRAHEADAAVQALDATSWLKKARAALMPEILAWDLGPGESSVLSWAHEHPGTVAVLDDLAARRCASAFGIPLRGTLGLVLVARRRGVIPSARAVAMELRESGLYLSEQVWKQALALVDE
jgi:predicted nucleic acid-binding protein